MGVRRKEDGVEGRRKEGGVEGWEEGGRGRGMGRRKVMANHFLRLSSSFACVPVKLAVGRKREIVLAYIVGEVHF